MAMKYSRLNFLLKLAWVMSIPSFLAGIHTRLLSHRGYFKHTGDIAKMSLARQEKSKDGEALVNGI